MAFGTRVWGAGKLLVLGGALLATYLLFAAASMRLALRAREVEVPDLINRTANEATAVASERGLLVRVDEAARPDPKVEAGRIVAQEPAAGQTLRSQRSIKVWISAGQHAANIPTLIGETERAAQMRVSQDGFKVSALSEIRSQRFPPDVVVAQDPAPNQQGGEVSLLVNRAERGDSYVMPDLIGVNGDRAIELLRSRGFRITEVGSVPYPGVAAGVVLRQSPRAGFQIAPGEPISIEVSR
jgi:eukaryotic-like serine/threonine-protein kinase